MLADHFLQLLRRSGRTKLAGFSDKALDALKTYSFPGNVRELKAIVEWAVLSAASEGNWVIEESDIPIEVIRSSPSINTDRELAPFDVEYAVARAELECVSRALIQSNGKRQKHKSSWATQVAILCDAGSC